MAITTYIPGIQFPVSGQPGAVMIGPRVALFNEGVLTIPSGTPTGTVENNGAIVTIGPLGPKDLVIWDYIGAQSTFAGGQPQGTVIGVDFELRDVSGDQLVPLAPPASVTGSPGDNSLAVPAPPVIARGDLDALSVIRLGHPLMANADGFVGVQLALSIQLLLSASPTTNITWGVVLAALVRVVLGGSD